MFRKYQVGMLVGLLLTVSLVWAETPADKKPKKEENYKWIPPEFLPGYVPKKKERGKLRVKFEDPQFCQYWPREKPVPKEVEERPDPSKIPDPFIPKEEEEQKEPPTRPPIIVKAKKTVIKGGKKHAKAMPGTHVKLVPPPPDLPRPGFKKPEVVDRGYEEGPIQKVTDKDGNALLRGTSPGHLDGGEPLNPIEVTVELTPFESYIAKIKVDRTKESWDDPESYLDPVSARFVARHWIVKDSMYVVMNVPKITEE